MEYKNQTYYWILPLDGGQWTLAKHIEGTWHFVDGRCRLTKDLGQVGEEIPSNDKLFEAEREKKGLIDELTNGVSLSGSHYNVAPPHFRETTKERFCHIFFTWSFKAQTSKQIHSYSNGKDLKKPIFDIRLWELAHYKESIGVAMQRDGDEIKYYIFGSEKQWTKFNNGVVAQFAGDNS